MKRIAFLAVAVGLFAFVAAPAFADEPTARDIQAAVDNYLASAEQDATLVGGPGSAGYDAGFWIRGGDFMLRINLTIQARYEWFDFDEPLVLATWQGDALDGEGSNGVHDLSGFSVPRTTLKFSGTAPCSVRYYAEFEFGHPGVYAWRHDDPTRDRPVQVQPEAWETTFVGAVPVAAEPTYDPLIVQSWNYDYGREAWIEWGCNDAFNFRMGLIKTPTTRQLMVPPELQQFVDISMASSVVGQLMPGYTDRNRDFGFMVHGGFGCRCPNEFQYMVAVTNGDGGDSTRNVLNLETSDNLAFSGRLNWAFLSGIGYTEGATRQNQCQWYGEVGAWAFYYADRMDRPHVQEYDRLLVGGDLALGYGGFSLTAAFTYVDLSGSSLSPTTAYNDESWIVWMGQLGYMFPGTAWEIAARWSSYTRTIDGAVVDGATLIDLEPTTNEIGAVVNYYLNGHANKMSVDVSFISAESDSYTNAAGVVTGLAGAGYFDVYAGVAGGWWTDGDMILARFQWQLAL